MGIREAKEHLEKAYALAASVHVAGRDVDFLAGARAEMQMAFQEMEKAETECGAGTRRGEGTAPYEERAEERRDEGTAPYGERTEGRRGEGTAPYEERTEGRRGEGTAPYRERAEERRGEGTAPYGEERADG